MVTAPTVQYYGTGRRKSSVARVFLRPGTGNFLVNKKPLDEYFGRETLKMVASEPLDIAESRNQFDVFIKVKGGGFTGQAGAIRHGLARALVVAVEEAHGSLKKAGMLTRDSREVERKKCGKPGARKSYQYSKR